MLRRIKVGRVAALLINPLPERHPNQVAFLVITPLVVNAGMAGLIPTGLAADHGSPMRAAIDKGVQNTFFVTRHHNRRVADKRGLKVTGAGNLGFEPDITPGRASEDAFLFTAIHRRITKDLIRDRGHTGCRPVEIDVRVSHR